MCPGPPLQFGYTITNATVEAGFGYTGTGAVEELDRYFCHPDHIGSSSVITNALGAVSECMAYMPFGEILASQKSTSYAVPYLFTSKELDRETGLYYFGARYYDPNEGRWWGVDPLAEKYPNTSPFVYTYNNPIRFVDPTGMEGEPPYLTGTYAHSLFTAYMRLRYANDPRWKFNLSIAGVKMPLRPDVVFDDRRSTAGVWELKPNFPSKSAPTATEEADFYSMQLNIFNNTTRFKPGTSGGAPVPFEEEMMQIVDASSGRAFNYSIPNPSTGAIFWDEVGKQTQPISQLSPIPRFEINLNPERVKELTIGATIAGAAVIGLKTIGEIGCRLVTGLSSSLLIIAPIVPLNDNTGLNQFNEML